MLKLWFYPPIFHPHPQAPPNLPEQSRKKCESLVLIGCPNLVPSTDIWPDSRTTLTLSSAMPGLILCKVLNSGIGVMTSACTQPEVLSQHKCTQNKSLLVP